MKTLKRYFFVCSLLCSALLPARVVAAGPASPATGVHGLAAAVIPSHIQISRVDMFDFHDTLQPVRARVFADDIDRANHDGSKVILVDLSTPGGLSASTDKMVKAMRDSRIPIIVWMGQPKTRITGEGLRLLAEADVALMSRGTYLTPLWSEVPRRLPPQARATGRQSLARHLVEAAAAHGRNASAVEELSSGIHWFSAEEALQAGMIDGLADHSSDAIRFAATHSIHRHDGTTLRVDLSNPIVDETATRPQDLLLLSLMNPDLAVLLLTLGMLLIYLEVNTPGTVVPGAAGVMLVLLAGYALLMLPLSGVGVLMCVLAVLLFLLESRLLTQGVLATIGVLLLVVGLGILVPGPLPQLEVSWGTAVGAGIGFGGVTACLLVLGAEARRAKVKTGAEAMLGWLAVAQTGLAPEGKILVRGELWNARLTSSDSSVVAGERVKVLRADGLTLEVTAVPVSQSA